MRRTAIVLGTLLLATSACGADDQTTGSMTPDQVRGARARLDPDLVAQLDSGNAALREGGADRAALHYGRATDMDDEVAAGWFGLYLAERARGDVVAAGAALDRARRIAPEANLIQPQPADSVP